MNLVSTLGFVANGHLDPKKIKAAALAGGGLSLS